MCQIIILQCTRNIWGIALVHCLDDLGTFLQSALTETRANLGGADTYANVGEVGIWVYSAQIVFALIAAIVIWNKVGKTIDFDKIRKTW